MKYIKELLLGVRVKGESLPTPTFKVTELPNRPTLDEWVKQVKFGNRYGHRGSFYNNNK